MKETHPAAFFQSGLLSPRAHAALARSTAAAAQYGLTFTPAQLDMLADAEARALRQAGRIEFGEGILPRLLYTFCDSPFLDAANAADTLADLQMLFCSFQNETGDVLSDDALLCAMRAVYDGAGGSLSYLEGVEPERLVRIAMRGEDAGPGAAQPQMPTDMDEEEDF